MQPPPLSCLAVGKDEKVHKPGFQQFTLPFICKVNEQVALFPEESNALNVTNVVPIPNRLPDALLHVTVGDFAELSEASGFVQCATAPDFPKLISIVWS